VPNLNFKEGENMKKNLLIILIFFFSCGILKYVKPRFERPHKVEGGILFQYYAPSARKVQIAGDFNNWEYGTSEKSINLKKNEEGVWSIILPLKPGRYKYKFVIDEKFWEKDPNGEDANDEMGNSLIVVE
jgi:1,4-alpha-glucan branching enzyme